MSAVCSEFQTAVERVKIAAIFLSVDWLKTSFSTPFYKNSYLRWNWEGGGGVFVKGSGFKGKIGSYCLIHLIVWWFNTHLQPHREGGRTLIYMNRPGQMCCLQARTFESPSARCNRAKKAHLSVQAKCQQFRSNTSLINYTENLWTGKCHPETYIRRGWEEGVKARY